jgi:hypothetical protein
MSMIPVDKNDPQARSDEFLKWLYEKTVNDPEFKFMGFDETWTEKFGQDALRLFNGLKQRQFFIYAKSGENSAGGYGLAKIELPVGLNHKAIAYLEKLSEPPPEEQPKYEEPPATESEPGREQDLTKDVAWFIYNTTGNMRTALNYLEDARVYLQKEPLVDRKQAEQEIVARGELELQIVTKEELGE